MIKCMLFVFKIVQLSTMIFLNIRLDQVDNSKHLQANFPFRYISYNLIGTRSGF